MRWTSFHIEDLTAEQQASAEPWLEFLRVPSLRAGLYVLTPGAWDHQSPHEEDEVYFVVSGRATFEAGREHREVRAGEVIYVAAHQEHRFTHIVEELRVLVFFLHPRPDGAGPRSLSSGVAMKTKSLLVWCVLVVLLTPSPAQAHTLLSELLLKMLLSDVVLAPPEGGAFQSHEAHFRPIIGGEVVSGFEFNQLEVPLAINSIMAAQLATIPLGSSSGGFSYTYDPALGTFSRESSTFGSAFVERALTAGRGRWNLGFTFQRATYDTIEGRDLDNGDVRVYLVHQDCCGTRNAPGVPPNPFFEGDVIENRLSLDLTSSVFSAYVNYGVTDRLDAGVVVPFVTIDMEASVQARVIRLATSETPASIRFPGAGSSERSASRLARRGWATSCCAASTGSSTRRAADSPRASTSAFRPATRSSCSGPAAPRSSSRSSARWHKGRSRRT